MASEDEVRGAFRAQKEWCRAMNAPVYARLCATVAETLTRATRTGARVLDWPGGAQADAIALRLLGGLNALVRARRDTELAAVFEGDVDGMDAALESALRRHDDDLYVWLDGPPQTNEVGRAAAITAALLVVAERFGATVELLELGSSAGLLLNLGRYRYHLGGVAAGDPSSPLLIAPEWRGAPPPSAPLDVRRAGCRSRAARPRRRSDARAAVRLCLAGAAGALARLERAVAVARAHPPRIDRADGADWIGQRLAEPQTDGVTRVVLHSVALQYLPPAGRARVRAAIEAAGARATRARPLAWISYEMDPARKVMALVLRTWPGREASELATCHPHATWIEWRDEAAQL